MYNIDNKERGETKMLYKQITKRQAGVIYRAYKESLVDVTDENIKSLYNLVDYRGYDDNGSMQRMNDSIQLAIEAVFENNYEKANEQLRRAFA